ncbi:hypothetical protein SprV_0501770500 [Sparganum proliferum]
MIGENQALYEKTLGFLREECLRLQAAVERSNSQRKPSTTLPDACLQPPPKRSRESSSSSKKIKKEESSVPDLEPKSSPPVPFISSALLPNPQSMAATALCTVRFDLLMSFNEARQDQLCIADPIHHFVWCMDACIRNKKIDRRHVCELVYHINRHRRRSSVRHGLESEVGLDQDTSADWAPDSDEKALTKKKTADVSLRFPRNQRTGEKRGPGTSADPDDDTFGSTPKFPRVGEVGPPENSYERDLQMICRDPCTVYTICSSLLRLVMSGLYEDKLPRNIPEVNFLVHLLMIGLEADLTPPEPVASTTAPVLTVSSSKSEVKNKHGHKRSASDDSVMSADSATETPVSPAVYLITQVLPAVGQLQVAAWRAEVGEKIRHISSNIWTDAWSPQTDPVPTQSSSRPSASWQRRLEIASPFTVSVPPAYLSHPVGNLFLQYHCLFALERREWVVLRALLKAAAGAAQQQARASKAAARAAASATGKSTAAPLSPVAGSSGGFSAASASPSYGFRWRPECLQALALGIAALPVSSDEASSKAPTLHGAGGGGGGSAGVGGSGGTGGAAERTGVAVGADNHPSAASIKLHRSASTGSSADHTSPIKQSQSPAAAVTRAELASLLRASLPLQNDLQLLVLALLSRLVPGTTAAGGGGASGGASQPSATPMPSYFSSTSAINPALSSQLSERERLINTLSRHCNFATESSQPLLPTSSVSAVTGFDQTAEPAGASTAVDSVALTTAGLSATTATGGTVASTAGGAVYRTSNPKVLEALEVLRRDFERTTPNLMPLLTKMGSSSSTGGPLGSSGKHATPSSPSAQAGPMSPFSSQMSAPPGYGLASTRLYNFEGGLSSPTGGFRPPPSASSSLRSTLGRYATPPSMETQGYQHSFASPRAPPRYGASSSYNQFPMATPFTNPGLASSSSVMPPPPALPPRLPVSPPPDYRPPSPATYSTDRPPLLMADEPAYSQSAGVAGSISPPTADLRRYAAPPVNMAMKPHSPPPESPPPGEGTPEGYT